MIYLKLIKARTLKKICENCLYEDKSHYNRYVAYRHLDEKIINKLGLHYKI